MPKDLAPKTIKVKMGDIHIRTSADMTAILWRDERDICTMTNIHNAPAEVNSCNEGRKAISPKLWWIITIIWSMWIRATKWPTSLHQPAHIQVDEKLFFHLLDLAILNSYILHSSCRGKKISHRDFRFTLVRNTLAHAGPERRIPRPLGRPSNVELQVAKLEACGRKHWPTLSEIQLRCRVCNARGVTKKFL